MKHILLIAFMLCAALCQAQGLSVSGKVEDTGGEAVPFANVALFVYPDTATLVGGCATDLGGGSVSTVFRLANICCRFRMWAMQRRMSSLALPEKMWCRMWCLPRSAYLSARWLWKAAAAYAALHETQRPHLRPECFVAFQ